MIRLYNTWEKVKDIFVKPSLKVYFGKWRNDPNLPVWRTGPIIHLCKSKSIYLPIWMRFYIVNQDVAWKHKWDYVSYEFPPQFSIIAFGLSLTFTLHCPVSKDYCHDDSYWGSILTHLYLNKSGELKETIDECGIWRRVGDEGRTEYFSVRPEFIIQDKQEEYYATTSEIKARYINRTIV